MVGCYHTSRSSNQGPYPTHHPCTGGGVTLAIRTQPRPQWAGALVWMAGGGLAPCAIRPPPDDSQREVKVVG